MNAIYKVDCPVCGEESSIRVVYKDEMQGEECWAALVTFLEEIDPECGCTLTQEQEDQILSQVDSDKIEPYEPDYDY